MLPASAPARLAGLGPIAQLAFVPRDFDQALAFWTRSMGVGPFFVWEHVALDQLVHRGEEIRADFSVALAYWGEVQIELIRPNDATATIYRDWNSDALHHVLIAVDNYPGALAICEREGFPVAMHGSGRSGSGSFRFAYCDLKGTGMAGYVEFAEYSGPPSARERQAAMKAAARNWNGEDPVRPMVFS